MKEHKDESLPVKQPRPPSVISGGFHTDPTDMHSLGLSASRTVELYLAFKKPACAVVLTTGNQLN